MKKIPSNLVKKYMQKDEEITQLAEEIKPLKEQLISYNERGYESSELRFEGGFVQSPDWKKLCTELTMKYMNPSQRRVWKSKVLKRFPRKPRAPRIRILSKQINRRVAA